MKPFPNIMHQDYQALLGIFKLNISKVQVEKVFIGIEEFNEKGNQTYSQK